MRPGTELPRNGVNCLSGSSTRFAGPCHRSPLRGREPLFDIIGRAERPSEAPCGRPLQILCGESRVVESCRPASVQEVGQRQSSGTPFFCSPSVPHRHRPSSTSPSLLLVVQKRLAMVLIQVGPVLGVPAKGSVW